MTIESSSSAPLPMNLVPEAHVGSPVGKNNSAEGIESKGSTQVIEPHFFTRCLTATQRVITDRILIVAEALYFTFRVVYDFVSVFANLIVTLIKLPFAIFVENGLKDSANAALSHAVKIVQYALSAPLFLAIGIVHPYSARYIKHQYIDLFDHQFSDMSDLIISKHEKALEKLPLTLKPKEEDHKPSPTTQNKNSEPEKPLTSKPENAKDKETDTSTQEDSEQENKSEPKQNNTETKATAADEKPNTTTTSTKEVRSDTKPIVNVEIETVSVEKISSEIEIDVEPPVNPVQPKVIVDDNHSSASSKPVELDSIKPVVNRSKATIRVTLIDPPANPINNITTVTATSTTLAEQIAESQKISVNGSPKSHKPINDPVYIYSDDDDSDEDIPTEPNAYDPLRRKRSLTGYPTNVDEFDDLEPNDIPVPAIINTRNNTLTAESLLNESNPLETSKTNGSESNPAEIVQETITLPQPPEVLE